MSAGATVTQDARNAASKCVRYLTGNTFAAVDIAQGRSDRSAIVETFARFETEIRLATAAEFAAREAALVEALRNLSDRWFLNGGELTAPAYVEAKALAARAHTTSEGEG